MRSLVLVVLGALAVSVAGQSNIVKCGEGQKCPEDSPCCSQYGQCGVGAYCLGGCNPRYSNQLESCVAEPVCQSQSFQFSSLDGIVPNTKYLGDPSKADWVSSGEPVPFEDSLLLTMPQDSVGTLLASTGYMLYGSVSATLRTSRGKGVVTAFILLSDVLDEIDFEFVGSDLETAQTNYYFQGITNYNNGLNVSLSDTFDNYHTYKIDWTPEEITWSIDGQVGRTKKREETYNDTSKRYEYPSTPARVQLSLWPGGIETNGKGTIDWAGGLIDWNSEDMQANRYYYAAVRDVNMECLDPPSDIKRSGSKSYVYTDDAGTIESVELTDKPTVLKSLLGTGTNMTADYASASSSSSSSSKAASATAAGGGSSSSTGAAAEPSSTEVATVPGLTGAGPGTNGQRGAGAPGARANSNSNSDSAADSGSGSGPSPSSSPSVPPSGFNQGAVAGADQGNGATAQGEKALGGSMFAGLVAVAGMLLL